MWYVTPLQPKSNFHCHSSITNHSQLYDMYIGICVLNANLGCCTIGSTTDLFLHCMRCLLEAKMKSQLVYKRINSLVRGLWRQREFRRQRKQCNLFCVKRDFCCLKLSHAPYSYVSKPKVFFAINFCRFTSIIVMNEACVYKFFFISDSATERKCATAQNYRNDSLNLCIQNWFPEIWA